MRFWMWGEFVGKIWGLGGGDWTVWVGALEPHPGPLLACVEGGLWGAKMAVLEIFVYVVRSTDNLRYLSHQQTSLSLRRRGPG
jgi:hypothetical protein